MAAEREPQPGEVCSCGRPAVTVFVTERFGDVPYCGIPDGGARWPWPNTAVHESDERSAAIDPIGDAP